MKTLIIVSSEKETPKALDTLFIIKTWTLKKRDSYSPDREELERSCLNQPYYNPESFMGFYFWNLRFHKETRREREDKESG